ncbi:MAG: succinate dehydrogenase cytochrome b subunit [Bacteroidales bacterium]|nr:succinate dehydrogenase cytochrome b subunit [Bacteroidales bacterium]MBK7175446.1 succinate dehydrogenase cytochrome b subunit [Bacteroidales bacterium]
MSHIALFYSSITKKVILALAGLFLITFLVLHLIINLLILSPDGGVAYSEAVHFMGTNPIIKFMEIFLFGGFAIHILLGIIIQIYNWMARPVRYKVEGFSHTSFFSKYMIHTGAIIFVFLLVHFFNFYFVKLGIVDPPAGLEREDFYQMAILLFSNNFYAILYIVLMLFLAFHLNHAFQSAFQTLGLNHSKYTPVVKWAGTIYSIIIPLGFALIPAYFLFIK